MTKNKKQKISYRAEFGRIVIHQNDESEFKIGFHYLDEVNNANRFWRIRDESRIADVSKEIWYAYREHRYAFEERTGASHTKLILADFSKRPSYHAEQGKENRHRSFYLLADNHPKDLEIRVEYRDGKKIMMLKKGNGADSSSPVIRRKELKLVADVREEEASILSNLPDEYKNDLGFEFNEKSGIYEPMQTNSQRLKTKVRLIQTPYGPLEFHMELAHDSGSGLTRNDLRWPIREYEMEVKGIYRPGEEIDLKEHPEILGISHEEVGDMCQVVLGPEREDFLEFATLFLLQKGREDPYRYGDICVEPVYYSKSSPGLTLLGDILDEGRKALHQLCFDSKTGEPRPFNW